MCEGEVLVERCVNRNGSVVEPLSTILSFIAPSSCGVVSVERNLIKTMDYSPCKCGPF